MTTTGPNSPGTAANIDRDAKQAWSTPDNAKVQSDSYAQQDMVKATYTDWLRLTNFGFGITGTATIDGILVQVDMYGETVNAVESSIRLVSGAVAVGDDKSTAAALTTSDTDTYRDYGGAADKWNAGFTYENINDSTFGVQISLANTHPNQARWAYIDHIQITIYYSVPSTESQEYYERSIGRGIGRGIFN